ncbi:hypothetical protein FBU30_008783 [Linnemannia zychae]|nr:hypothetical protein FBU30_008783 [Linnemannia zychae]
MKFTALIPAALLAMSSSVFAAPTGGDIVSSIEFLCMAGDKIKVGSNNRYQSGVCKTVNSFYDGCSGTLTSSCNKGTWTASYCVGANSAQSYAILSYGSTQYHMSYNAELSRHYDNHCYSVIVWG